MEGARNSHYSYSSGSDIQLLDDYATDPRPGEHLKVLVIRSHEPFELKLSIVNGCIHMKELKSDCDQSTVYTRTMDDIHLVSSSVNERRSKEIWNLIDEPEEKTIYPIEVQRESSPTASSFTLLNESEDERSSTDFSELRELATDDEEFDEDPEMDVMKELAELSSTVRENRVSLLEYISPEDAAFMRPLQEIEATLWKVARAAALARSAALRHRSRDQRILPARKSHSRGGGDEVNSDGLIHFIMEFVGNVIELLRFQEHHEPIKNISDLTLSYFHKIMEIPIFRDLDYQRLVTIFGINQPDPQLDARIAKAEAVRSECNRRARMIFDRSTDRKLWTHARLMNRLSRPSFDARTPKELSLCNFFDGIQFCREGIDNHLDRLLDILTNVRESTGSTESNWFA